LFFSGPFLPEADAGAIHSKDRRDFAVRNTAHDAGSLARFGSMKIVGSRMLEEVKK
jgi:hypothetical protein